MTNEFHIDPTEFDWLFQQRKANQTDLAKSVYGANKPGYTETVVTVRRGGKTFQSHRWIKTETSTQAIRHHARDIVDVYHSDIIDLPVDKIISELTFLGESTTGNLNELRMKLAIGRELLHVGYVPDRSPSGGEFGYSKATAEDKKDEPYKSERFTGRMVAEPPKAKTPITQEEYDKAVTAALMPHAGEAWVIHGLQGISLKGKPLDKLEATMADAEVNFLNEYAHRPEEHSCEYDKDGKLLFHASGDDRHVVIPRADVIRLSESACYSVHNHPAIDVPFSPEDISFMNHIGVREGVVYSPKHRYYINFHDMPPKDRNEFMDVYHKYIHAPEYLAQIDPVYKLWHELKDRIILESPEYVGGIRDSVAWDYYTQACFATACNEFNIEYSVTDKVDPRATHEGRARIKAAQEKANWRDKDD